MTDHRRLQDNIVSKLSWYVTNLKLNTALDYYDENRDAEFFFQLPLSLAFNADVQDLNAQKRNFPGIDLGDCSKRICFQITSTNTKTKVQHTLDKFLEYGLDEYFDRLVILIVNTDSLPSLANLQFQRPFDFDVFRDVWNMPRLIRHFDALPPKEHHQLQQLSDYLDQQLPGAAPMFERLRLPPVSTLHKHNFLGREIELSQIATQLKNGDKPIVLSGLGGMGKTELALRFGQDYKDGAVHFIRFDSSFARTIATMSVGISPRLTPYEASLPNDVRFCKVMRILEQSSRNDILIIDNVDTGSRSLAELMKEDAYQDLLLLDCRLILTTRFSFDQAIQINQLPEDVLFQIFRKRGVSLPEDQMRDIINAVDHHTMTIDLIVRTLKDNWVPVSAEEMLQSLKEKALPDAHHPAVTTDYNRSPEQLRIYHHLQTVFNVASLPVTQKQVLRCAVLIPETGMNLHLFYHALGIELLESLTALGQQGWLASENSQITIHPVIRMVCIKELKPNDQTCGNFLKSLRAQYNPEESTQAECAQIAEVFSLAADILEDSTAEWVNQCGFLLLELKQFQETKELYQKHLSNLENRFWGKAPLATAYNNIGIAYRQLGEYDTALKYHMQDLEICLQVLPPNHPDLAIAYDSVGTTLRERREYALALEYELKAMQIRDQLPPDDQLPRATSYLHVGIIYSALEDYAAALEYKLKAMTIFENILHNDNIFLADVYTSVSDICIRLSNDEVALAYQLKALAIYEKVLPSSDSFLSEIYSKIYTSYNKLGDYQKALEYQLKDLAIREIELPLDSHDLAIPYRNIGNTYSKLGYYGVALAYKKKALAIKARTLPEDHVSLTEFYSDLGIAYFDLGDYFTAWRLWRKSTKILIKVQKKQTRYENKYSAGHQIIEATQHEIALIKNHQRQLGVRKVLTSIFKNCVNLIKH